jgi:4-amino-4-deoxy-L-arabinose transferase-like glycosyltransferase
MEKIKRLTLPQIVVIIALCAGAFLRLWNFPNTLQFLGDQGRDASIARHIFQDKKPVLIGPVTSTGNMYLGPLYYYMMVPFLMLTYPSPIGPAYAIAFLSIATIFLIYYLGRELVGEKAAAIAAVFFAFSSAAITFARFSWNPNPAPFFSLVLIWAVHRALTKNPWYFVVVSTCAAVLMQLHYVSVLCIPLAGIFWLVALREVCKQKSQKKLLPFVLATLTAIVVFIAFATPLILFDLRHDFLNLRSLQAFVTGDSGGFNHGGSLFRMYRVIKETHGRSLQILFEVFIGKFRQLNTFLVLFTIGFFGWMYRQKKQPHQLGITILLALVIISVIGLSFYQSSVFDHYIAFLYPVTFLLYGVILDALSRDKRGIFVGGVFFIGFLAWNTQHLPLKPLSWKLEDIHRSALDIASKVKPGEKYNIVLLTGTGDIEGLNYRYFLETTDKPPLPKERWGETETLFIINEDKKLKRVVDSPIYEIVVFPNKTPAEVYTIPNGPDITILRK